MLKINFAYLLAYRANFITHLISAFSWGAFQIVWIVLLTGKRGVVFGWTQKDMILLTLGFFMVIGIFHFLFSSNFYLFSRVIDRGEFDAILLKPIDSQFHSTMRVVNYANFVRACVGLILIIGWLVMNHYTVTFIQIVLFSFYIVVGIITTYSIWLLFMTTLIWYPSLNNMVEFLFTLNGFMKYPGEMIRFSGTIVLYLLLPLVLAVSTPVKILVRKNSLEDMIVLSLIAICLFIISRLFWKYALKSYTSAS